MTFRQFIEAMKARARAVGQLVLRTIAKEPVLIITGLVTLVSGIVRAVQEEGADGVFTWATFAPVALGLVIRFAHLFPVKAIGEALGVFSPASVEDLVNDDGRGVSPEEVARFFEEMAKVDDAPPTG